MVRHLGILILSLTLVASVSPAALAQAVEGQTSGKSQGPRRQVATIIFAGLSGAILGLSTLSFYGRPQDKLINIAYGGAIGVIIGASYTTYKAATYQRTPYEVLPEGVRYQYEPETWKLADAPEKAPPKGSLGTGWQWQF